MKIKEIKSFVFSKDYAIIKIVLTISFFANIIIISEIDKISWYIFPIAVVFYTFGFAAAFFAFIYIVIIPSWLASLLISEKISEIFVPKKLRGTLLQKSIQGSFFVILFFVISFLFSQSDLNDMNYRPPY